MIASIKANYPYLRFPNLYAAKITVHSIEKTTW